MAPPLMLAAVLGLGSLSCGSAEAPVAQTTTTTLAPPLGPMVPVEANLSRPITGVDAEEICGYNRHFYLDTRRPASAIAVANAQQLINLRHAEQDIVVVRAEPVSGEVETFEFDVDPSVRPEYRVASAFAVSDVDVCVGGIRVRRTQEANVFVDFARSDVRIYGPSEYDPRDMLIHDPSIDIPVAR